MSAREPQPDPPVREPRLAMPAKSPPRGRRRRQPRLHLPATGQHLAMPARGLRPSTVATPGQTCTAEKKQTVFLFGAEERLAGAKEEVAGVPVRKGCLKKNEAKKVTFAVEEEEEEEGPVRIRSLSDVYQSRSPVFAKKRGKSAQAGSGEVGADPPLRRSRRNSVSAAEVEQVEVDLFVDKKRTRKNQEKDEGAAVSSQVGATRRSSLVGAAAVLPCAVERKRGRGEAAGARMEVPAMITTSRSIPPVEKDVEKQPVRRSRRSVGSLLDEKMSKIPVRSQDVNLLHSPQLQREKCQKIPRGDRQLLMMVYHLISLLDIVKINPMWIG